MKIIDLPIYLVVIFSILVAIFPNNYAYLGVLAANVILAIFAKRYEYDKLSTIESKYKAELEQFKTLMEFRLDSTEKQVGLKLVEINDKFGALNLSRSLSRRE